MQMIHMTSEECSGAKQMIETLVRRGHSLDEAKRLT